MKKTENKNYRTAVTFVYEQVNFFIFYPRWNINVYSKL